MNPMTFKFRLLNAKGRPQGFLRSKGQVVPDEGLKLKDHTIPFAAIRHMQLVKKDILLLVMGDDAVFGLSMPGKAGRLMRALAPAVSSAHAAAHRVRLVERGMGDKFRTTGCAHCGATVDLSGMPQSEAVYCRYCDRITQEGVAPKQTGRFRCCDSCGFFARPRLFTEFYFYFLLVIYGFSYNKHEFCGVCMREKAWRMLGINAIFILGVPVALVQLYRAYFGSPGASSLYPGLEKGNALAMNGKRDKAEIVYEGILAQSVSAAGVHYNRGLAALRVRDAEGAILAFEESLDDCTNYLPAYAHLRRLYEGQGEHERVRELDALWDAADALDEALAAPA